MADVILKNIIELKRRKIRIEGEGLERRVLLDGVDISRFVRQVDIQMVAGMAFADVTLHVFGMVELPDELDALLHVDVAPVMK